MIFSKSDMKSVRKLLVPDLGTERLAPLLYCLTMFTRAQRVLEAGSGYTTPFICKALEANQLAFEREGDALRRKTASYLADIDELDARDSIASRQEQSQACAPVGLAALYGAKPTPFAERRFQWLMSAPSWVRPSYYLNQAAPMLFSVDDLSGATVGAKLAHDVTERLGLSKYVTFIDKDFWSVDSQLLSTDQLDVIWIDIPVGIGSVMTLISGQYWNQLRANGLLIIHDMLTTLGGQIVTDVLRAQCLRRGNEFEILGLLEPNRLMQGDIIIIRKTTPAHVGPVDAVIQAPGSDSLEQEAREFMKRCDGR